MRLPEISESHKQERRSITAFRNEMEGNYFVVRDCRENDYGVDMTLEVIIDKKYASNFISCVQLKDKLNSKIIQNINGDYSYAINIENINYLLNNPNSLFFIYLEDKKVFIWEWIEKIAEVVNERNINLYETNKKTFTYRFNKILDENSKSEIHTKIMKVSKSMKEFSIFISKKNSGLIYGKIITEPFKIIKSFEAKCINAEEYVNNGQIDKALKIYKDILKIYSDNNIFMRCAELELILGKYNMSLKYFNTVLKVDTKNKKAFWGVICSYKGMKKYKKEKKLIESKIKYIEFAEVYHELARLYIIEGSSDKAIKLLTKSCVTECLYEENIHASKLFLAEIYLMSFNFVKAREYIDLILKEDKNNSNAIALLGDYYFELNDYTKAISNFTIALENDKNNYYSLRGLSLIYFDKNEYNKALIYFKGWIKTINIRRDQIDAKTVIIHIGWEKTIVISYEIDNRGFINISLGNGKLIQSSLVDENDNIIIGVMQKIESQYREPIVGKVFMKKTDYYLAIENIKKGLSFVEFNKKNGYNVESTSKTKLYIEENKNNVFINIDFNGYNIIGFTDMKNNKKAYKEFEKAYNKKNSFRVIIKCEEITEEFQYTVNNNVKIKKKKNNLT